MGSLPWKFAWTSEIECLNVTDVVSEDSFIEYIIGHIYWKLTLI